MSRWLRAAGLASTLAGVAYWRRALTLDGALGAAGVGCVAYARGGTPAAAALLAFFASSSALSRVGQRRKQSSPLAQAKGGRRDVWQVLANGGVATLAIGLGSQPGRSGFVGALAAASADTWATELGLLTRRRPRLITTLRPVEAGTSGGVTPEGLAASLGGALIVGLAWGVTGGAWRGLPTAAVAGVCGSLFDSLVGASLQALFRCPACGALTESDIHASCRRATATELVRGQRWVTNDVVNALATLAGAAIGVVCWPRKASKCHPEERGISLHRARNVEDLVQ